MKSSGESTCTCVSSEMVRALPPIYPVVYLRLSPVNFATLTETALGEPRNVDDQFE